MEALECITGRRSIRSYTGRKIEKKVLEQIVNAGRLAPTENNNQPWEFVVVTQKERLEKIGSIATHGDFIMNAAACILVFCRQTKHFCEDGCAATENILLAANCFGIGGCWVPGGRQAYSDEVSGFAGAPQDCKLVSMVSLGYPAGGPDVKPKRTLGQVLHWENF